MLYVFRAIHKTSRYTHKVHVALHGCNPLCGNRGRPSLFSVQWKYTAGPPTCAICRPIWEKEIQNPELPMT